MTLVKWEPFRDLMAMQDRMTRLIDETLSRIWKEDVVQGAWSRPWIFWREETKWF